LRFRYHLNGRQQLRFNAARDNSDWAFVRSLYVLFWRHVLALNPKEQIEADGRRHSTILLAMLWIEKSVQMALRLRQIGISDEKSFGPVVEELQKVYRAWDELHASGEDCS
jgi:hypothetical protein